MDRAGDEIDVGLGIAVAPEDHHGCGARIDLERRSEVFGNAVGHHLDLGVMRPLAEIANTERRLPDEFISPAGNNITDAFIEYALPLIGGPLPQYVRL